MSKNDILITDLSKTYHDVLVFSSVNFTLKDGRAYCLTAPSGRGKTTFFKILMGLEQPDSGTIIGLSGRRISAVFQDDRLLEGYNALENIRFVTGKQISDAVLEDYLSRLSLQDSSHKKVCEFSGGMKRRLCILRCLLAPSDFLIMDEPFAGLDPDNKLAAIKLIRELTAGKLLLTATHDVQDAQMLGAEILYL